MTKNIEIEQALIGSALRSPNLWHECSHVKASAFQRAAHRALWTAITKMHSTGEPVDLLTVKAELDPSRYGGVEYLVSIHESVASGAQTAHYAKLVTEHAERREVAKAAQRVIELAQDEDSEIETVRAAANSMREATSGSIPLIHIADVDDTHAEDGVPTGYACLDKSISTGGYPKGQITVVSAYHKGGKSSLMLGSALKCSERGLRVLYATFADLSARNIRRRLKKMMCGYSKVPGSLEKIEEYDKAVESLDLSDFYLFDATAAEDRPTVEAFCAWVRSHHSHFPWDIVFVDYAQELSTSAPNCFGINDEQTKCASALVWLAVKLDIPVVVGSQITPGKDGGMAITKGSRSWEEKAGWVLRIPESKEEVKIAFSRFGPQNVSLGVRWNDDRLMFEEAR